LIDNFQEREFYVSSNGDRWALARDESGTIAVHHYPNPPSGGQVARMGVGEFLVENRGGPQHAELLRLIGTLIETDAGVLDGSPAGVTPDASP
jgi:hypothetical protein